MQEHNEDVARVKTKAYNDRLQAIAEKEEREHALRLQEEQRAREYGMRVREQQQQSTWHSSRRTSQQHYPPYQDHNSHAPRFPSHSSSSDEIMEVIPDSRRDHPSHSHYDRERHAKAYADDDAAKELEAAADASARMRHNGPERHTHHQHHQGGKRHRLEPSDSFHRTDDASGSDAREAAADLEMEYSIDGGDEGSRKRRRVDAAEALEREALMEGSSSHHRHGGRDAIEDELASVAGLRSPHASTQQKKIKGKARVKHEAPFDVDSATEWAHEGDHTYQQHHPSHHPHRHDNGQSHHRQYHDQPPYPVDDGRPPIRGPPATDSYTPPPTKTKKKASARKRHPDPSGELIRSGASTPIPFADARGHHNLGSNFDDRPSSSNGLNPQFHLPPPPPVQPPFTYIGHGDPSYGYGPMPDPKPQEAQQILLYPLDAPIPKHIAPPKEDKVTLAKRLHDVENIQMRVWLQLVRDEIPKVCNSTAYKTSK